MLQFLSYATIPYSLFPCGELRIPTVIHSIIFHYFQWYFCIETSYYLTIDHKSFLYVLNNLKSNFKILELALTACSFATINFVSPKDSPFCYFLFIDAWIHSIHILSYWCQFIPWHLLIIFFIPIKFNKIKNILVLLSLDFIGVSFQFSERCIVFPFFKLKT